MSAAKRANLLRSDVKESILRWYGWDYRKHMQAALLERDDVADDDVARAIELLPTALASGLSEALAAYAASWQTRFSYGGDVTDAELIATRGNPGFDNGIAALILHAYRAVEAVLGGPLPSRDPRLERRVTERVGNVEAGALARLVREIRHVEGTIRGPALHGASRGRRARLSEALRTQRLARRLVRDRLSHYQRAAKGRSPNGAART